MSFEMIRQIQDQISNKVNQAEKDNLVLELTIDEISKVVGGHGSDTADKGRCFNQCGFDCVNNCVENICKNKKAIGGGSLSLKMDG